MKKLSLIFIILLSFTSQAKEANKILCSSLYYSSVKKIAEKYGSFDKYKHCAVSCMLTLRCPSFEVFEVGIIKELVDTVGPGNAEFADLQADYQGVELASTYKAKLDSECIRECHRIYPERQCH